MDFIKSPEKLHQRPSTVKVLIENEQEKKIFKLPFLFPSVMEWCLGQKWQPDVGQGQKCEEENKPKTLVLYRPVNRQSCLRYATWDWGV